MDKKIYALKNGEHPGIYMSWLSFFAQIDGKRDVISKSFIYKTEFENEDETVEFSLKWALKKAEKYLADEDEKVEDTDNRTSEKAKHINNQTSEKVKHTDNQTSEKVKHTDNQTSEEAKHTDNQTSEEVLTDSNHISREGNQESEERKTKERKTKEEQDLSEELHKKLWLEDELRMGSPWLDLLLSLAGTDHPRISGGRYTGRYFAASLYTMLLYLILDTDKVLDEVFDRHELLSQRTISQVDKENWYNCIKYELFRSAEFMELKDRFYENKMDKLDLGEIKHRNIEFADGMKLLNTRPSYQSMKHFIMSGYHTIADLYKELIGKKVYQKELTDITGPFHNPDLAYESEEENKVTSLENLVLQATDIRLALKNVVIGQDEAIDKLEKAFFHSEKARKKENAPRNVYLFAGPPGVGKTYMAENFAKVLGRPYRRFDMSGYASVNSLDEMAGISSFFRNSKPGVLTSYVNQNPKSVLLFDEIEKANGEVIRMFLQILDEGTCFDRYYDRNVSFQECIIIMTTNAGRQLYMDAGNENLTELPDRVIIDALEKDNNPDTKNPYFPPELVSRMASHTIIMFNNLKADAIRQVIKNDIAKILKENKEDYGFDISMGNEIVAATVQYSIGGSGDARNASRLAGKLIDKEIYELFALLEEKYGTGRRERLEQISWECDFTESSDEIRQFYLGEKDCIVPILKHTDKEYEMTISKQFQVRVVNDIEAFMEIIRNEKVLFAVIDYAYGMKDAESSISIADAGTVGSKAFTILKNENADIPVFLLMSKGEYLYSESEKRTLRKRGAEDFIEEENLAKQLSKVYSDICCKNAMELLHLRHQVLTYATRKEINANGTMAKIIFYHLKLEMAVDAEDKDSLISDELRPDKKWEDVYVSDDIKDELMFFVKYLKNTKAYLATGVRVPRGALMYGPPGTGKTSLAKVVASESNVNFLSVSADELLNGGAEKVHHIFRVARKYAPAVLFIDEIDAIGMSRTITGANAVLNALLTEMDGFKRVDTKPVFVMAATNLREIDPALARRFDRTFMVNLPDKKGRRWVLNRLIEMHKEMFDISGKEIESIVARSKGLSPADLENVIETALREGIRSGIVIEDGLLDEIFEKCNFGEKFERSSEMEVEHTAYHEAGHAMIELYYGRSPEYMSVVARENFGGYVQPEKIGEHPTKERLLQRICTSLGGRAAELEFGYGLTPGASGDLLSATNLARKMVCEYGMYEEQIGLAVITEEEYQSDAKAKALVNTILKEQLEQARAIINENRDAVIRLVKAVLHSEQKSLTKKDIMKAYKNL